MATPMQRLAGKPWRQMPRTNSTVHWNPEQPPGKGEYGGLCQRIACENHGAHWFNETNGRYYCVACARTFNEVCRRHGQPPLCELRL